MTSLSSPRGVQGWMTAVLAGVASAAAFAVATTHAETVLIFLAYAAALPLFIAGLGASLMPGFLAAAVGTGGVFLAGQGSTALVYALINAVPVVLLVALALRYRDHTDNVRYWYPEGYLLTALVLYPCAVFLFANLAVSGEDGGLLGMTTRALDGALSEVSAELDAEMALRFKNLMLQLARFMPALVGCSWMMLILVSGLVGQAALVRKGWNLRPSFTLEKIQVTPWLMGLVAATGLVGFFMPAPYDYVGTNLCVMLCVPLFFVGVAVVHSFAATLKTRRMVLVIFYILLSLFAWIALPITLLGALDQAFHIRLRFAAPRNN